MFLGLLSLATPQLVGVLLFLRGRSLRVLSVTIEATALLGAVSTPSMFGTELVASFVRRVLLLQGRCCLLLGDIVAVKVFGSLYLCHESNKLRNGMKEGVKSLTIHLLMPTLGYYGIQEYIDDLIGTKSLIGCKRWKIRDLQRVDSHELLIEVSDQHIITL